MKPKTILELESIVIDARDYLLKYFDVSRGYINFFGMNLPNDILGRFRVDEDRKLYIDIDEDKLIRKLKKGNLEDKFELVLDLVIGEEVGHLLFYLTHKEMHEHILPEYYGGLKFVHEVIGHYAGIVYANRNSLNQSPLKLDTKNEKAYELANQLYAKHGDAKLAELSKVKSLAEFSYLIKNYEV